MKQMSGSDGRGDTAGCGADRGASRPIITPRAFGATVGIGWTDQCERSACRLEVLFSDPRDRAGRFVSPRSWLVVDAEGLQFAAGKVPDSTPEWDLMDCDFCGEPVENGDVYVRVFGQVGHSGEAHLRCPWWIGIGVRPGPVVTELVRAAEAGLWPDDEPYPFAEFREDGLFNLGEALRKGEIDVGLEGILRAVNSHPRVCTSYSCRGHAGGDGEIQMHTDDGGLSRRIKQSLARYRGERDREWDRTYSRQGHWFVTLSLPAEETAFGSFCARLLDELGLS